MRKKQTGESRNEKFRIDCVVGMNIRAERAIRKLSREELAEIMEMTVSHIGLIERGERGVTARNLYKFSQVFKVPVSNFFKVSDVSEKPSGEDKDKISQTRLKIADLITRFNDYELEYVAHMMKNIAEYNHKSLLRHENDD